MNNVTIEENLTDRLDTLGKQTVIEKPTDRTPRYCASSKPPLLNLRPMPGRGLRPGSCSGALSLVIADFGQKSSIL